MLKEFFLVDYHDLNSFKEISSPLLDLATESFLLIAAIFELFKGFIGKSNPESRITIFILAAISMSVFNQYNQKVLDVSFSTSDKILSKLHITSMAKISDVMNSTPGEHAEKNNKKFTDNKKSNPEIVTGILGEARIFMANNMAIAIAWLISVIAIGLSKILFTVIYYALVVLSPIIIFISVFPGYESSLKVFWQTFIWCFLAPIVFSVIFVLMHLIAQKETPSGTGLEALIGVLLYGIFLVGSFVMAYKISTSQPISGFAEQASMIGAMAMAAPFTGAASFAQSAIHSPLQTYARTKESLGALKRGVEKLSNGKMPHSGTADISKMNHAEIEKTFGAKTASKLYSERAKQDYLGNKFGLSFPEDSQGKISNAASNTPMAKTQVSAPSEFSSHGNGNSNSKVGNEANTNAKADLNRPQLSGVNSRPESFQANNSAAEDPAENRINSIQSLKSQYMAGVHNIEPGRGYANSNRPQNIEGAIGQNKGASNFYKASTLAKNNSRFGKGKFNNYKKQNTHA